MSIAIASGALLAALVLGYVLYPLLRRRSPSDALPLSARDGLALGHRTRHVTDDEIEAAIRSYRLGRLNQPACEVCGRRPERDALFCSSCGRRVPRVAERLSPPGA